MTRIKRIRRRHQQRHAGSKIFYIHEDITVLLAEIDRLQAVIDRLEGR